MASPFRYYLRVRYGECDAQKVVFNSRYSEYVDVATSEFLRALGFSQIFIVGALDFQVVKQTVEWKAAARYDQVLELSMEAVHLGNTSFTLAAEFRVAGQSLVIATAQTVYVLVEVDTLRKTPLPADLRGALARGAPDAVTDHAGYFAISDQNPCQSRGESPSCATSDGA